MILALFSPLEALTGLSITTFLLLLILLVVIFKD